MFAMQLPAISKFWIQSATQCCLLAHTVEMTVLRVKSFIGAVNLIIFVIKMLIFNRYSAFKCQIKLVVNIIIEPRHEISNNVVFATSKASDQPAHSRSLIRTFASRSNILCLLCY